MIVPDDFIIRNKENRKEIKLKDKRTHRNSEGIFQVYPIAVNDFSIFVICPFCGNIHVHGQIEGFRTPDCMGNQGSYYVISERKWLDANNQHPSSKG